MKRNMKYTLHVCNKNVGILFNVHSTSPEQPLASTPTGKRSKHDRQNRLGLPMPEGENLSLYN